MLLTEVVNRKVFQAGFHQTKEILDGKYKLVATAGYIPYSPTKQSTTSNQFRIEARTAKGVQIGWVNFEIKDDHLEALDLSVEPAHRRKGIATEMYRFAKELGNTIKASDKQTALGKQFWNKDHSK